jgi:hypothetical protein
MAFAAATALALAAPSVAAQDVPIEENTCNADNQNGDDCVFTTVVKNNPEGIYVDFTSSPEMCSKITAHIGIGEPQPHLIGQDLLAPGETGKKYYIAGPGNSAGYTSVYVHANGQNGGCNEGGLREWSGTLHVEDRGYSLPGH